MKKTIYYNIYDYIDSKIHHLLYMSVDSDIVLLLDNPTVHVWTRTGRMTYATNGKKMIMDHMKNDNRYVLMNTHDSENRYVVFSEINRGKNLQGQNMLCPCCEVYILNHEKQEIHLCFHTTLSDNRTPEYNSSDFVDFLKRHFRESDNSETTIKTSYDVELLKNKNCENFDEKYGKIKEMISKDFECYAWDEDKCDILNREQSLLYYYDAIPLFYPDFDEDLEYCFRIGNMLVMFHFPHGTVSKISQNAGTFIKWNNCDIYFVKDGQIEAILFQRTTAYELELRGLDIPDQSENLTDMEKLAVN